jgi:acetyl-CoA synthetase
MSDIDTLFLEERRYPPPPDFAAQANAQPSIYDEPFEAFWEREGRERVTWFQPFTSLYEWELPYAKWYLGGKLNVSYNCVDRHVEAGRGDKVAFHWEGEPGDDRRALTYADLQREVTAFANTLKELGVRKGTAVGIYMGMVPELPIAMLACTRLGAPHTVVFGGFGGLALRPRERHGLRGDRHAGRGVAARLDRAAETDRRRGDGGDARRQEVPRRPAHRRRRVDARRPRPLVPRRARPDDPASCPPEPMDSEDLLFLMYTSGTTAKPKGIAHTTAVTSSASRRRTTTSST